MPLSSTYTLWQYRTTYTSAPHRARWYTAKHTMLRNDATVGCSRMWCFRMWGFKLLLSKPPHHLSFRCEVPTPSVSEGQSTTTTIIVKPHILKHHIPELPKLVVSDASHPWLPPLCQTGPWLPWRLRRPAAGVFFCRVVSAAIAFVRPRNAPNAGLDPETLMRSVVFPGT